MLTLYFHESSAKSFLEKIAQCFKPEVSSEILKDERKFYLCSHKYKFYGNNEIKLLYPQQIIVNYENLNRIGGGAFGYVYHAHWISKNMCIALKIYEVTGGKREVEILKYFNNLTMKYIIKMYGYQEHHDMFEGKQVIAMELGGMSLKKYFYYKSKETNKERENLQDVIIKLLKGAALAVEEFHKHAIHLDIKDDNFVLSREQKNENIIYSKLIDFNISVLKSDINSAPVRSAAEIYKAPEIRNNDTSKVTEKVDIWSFGVMSLNFLQHEKLGDIVTQRKMNKLDEKLKSYRENNENKTILDRVIKACIQLDPKHRPTFHAINNFLNENCDYFQYELDKFKEGSHRLCNDKAKPYLKKFGSEKWGTVNKDTKENQKQTREKVEIKRSKTV